MDSELMDIIHAILFGTNENKGRYESLISLTVMTVLRSHHLLPAGEKVVPSAVAAAIAVMIEDQFRIGGRYITDQLLTLLVGVDGYMKIKGCTKASELRTVSLAMDYFHPNVLQKYTTVVTYVDDTVPVVPFDTDYSIIANMLEESFSYGAPDYLANNSIRALYMIEHFNSKTKPWHTESDFTSNPMKILKEYCVIAPVSITKEVKNQTGIALCCAAHMYSIKVEHIIERAHANKCREVMSEFLHGLSFSKFEDVRHVLFGSQSENETFMVSFTAIVIMWLLSDGALVSPQNESDIKCLIRVKLQGYLKDGRVSNLSTVARLLLGLSTIELRELCQSADEFYVDCSEDDETGASRFSLRKVD